MTVKEYNQYKVLIKKSLIDNMSELEVALSDIGKLFISLIYI